MNHRLLAAALLVAAVALTACSNRTDPGDTPTPGSPSATTSGTAAPATPTPIPVRTPSPGDPAAYDNEAAIEHIHVLSTDIGSRVAGSQGERAAVDYIRDQFEASGYAVGVAEFSYTGNRFPLSSVVAGETNFEAYALQGSGSGSAQGPAVSIGIGDAAGIADRDLTGAVAVAERGVIPFRTKYLNAREAGALALVVINDEPGALTNGKLDAPGAFPVVGVAQEDGAALRLAAESGLVLQVEARTDDSGQGLNVLARANPNVPCLILVGGHHDSVPGVPGANDNASGVAHVLELARAFAADGLDDGLCFATFGAEESGLYGSKELVRRLTGEGGMPQVMLNLDVTSIGPDVEAIGTPGLVQRAVDIGTAVGIATRAASLPPNTGSDHTSFELGGADVIFLTSGDFSTIHSPQDTFESVQADELERVGKVALATLAALYDEVAHAWGAT